MIVILKPSIDICSIDYQYTLQVLGKIPNVELKMNVVSGSIETITEIYLIGETGSISKETLEALPGVARVIRISQEYKVLGHKNSISAFEYNGVAFSQENLTIFPGLCAVDNPENTKKMMKTLHAHGQVCTRMGAYKPRTNPHSFQGLGKECLYYVFDLAGAYGIKVIAMEVTHERQIEEIYQILDKLGHPTGVMLQIGTRNAQNFELLRAIGSQQIFPILFKRGYGITLNESLHAAEYLAHAGNNRIIFCLRGVKSLFAHPHRNFVDFAHVPVVKRLTCMPVGIDPSHSVGILNRNEEINDIYHVTAQGVISGANLILVDFHPHPSQAVVDSRQALSINELGWYLDDIAIAREAYLKRKELARKQAEKHSKNVNEIAIQ